MNTLIYYAFIGPLFCKGTIGNTLLILSFTFLQSFTIRQCLPLKQQFKYK